MTPSATSSGTRSAAPSARRSTATTDESSNASTGTRPTTSSTSTATRPWSSAGSSPSCGRFVTVIAGIGKTDRRRLFFWSAVGALLWVVSVTLLGYFVRQALPVLLDKLDVAIVLVVLVCLIPAAFEWWRHRRHRADDRVEQPQADTPRQDPA